MIQSTLIAFFYYKKIPLSHQMYNEQKTKGFVKATKEAVKGHIASSQLAYIATVGAPLAFFFIFGLEIVLNGTTFESGETYQALYNFGINPMNIIISSALFFFHHYYSFKKSIEAYKTKVNLYKQYTIVPWKKLMLRNAILFVLIFSPSVVLKDESFNTYFVYFVLAKIIGDILLSTSTVALLKKLRLD